MLIRFLFFCISLFATSYAGSWEKNLSPEYMQALAPYVKRSRKVLYDNYDRGLFSLEGDTFCRGFYKGVKEREGVYSEKDLVIFLLNLPNSNKRFAFAPMLVFTYALGEFSSDFSGVVKDQELKKIAIEWETFGTYERGRCLGFWSFHDAKMLIREIEKKEL